MNAEGLSASEVYVTAVRVRRFRAVQGIFSWQSMPRCFDLPVEARARSQIMSMRGVRHDIFVTFVESISRHARSVHQVGCLSRLALSMTQVYSRGLRWSHGLRRCRNFIYCRPMCPLIRKCLVHRYETKRPNMDAAPNAGGPRQLAT